jgi:filamentous hemagglutinin
VAAQIQGNSALSGASGATIGEFIAQEMYPGVKRGDLTEEQRQTISSLSTLAAGLIFFIINNFFNIKEAYSYSLRNS